MTTSLAKQLKKLQIPGQFSQSERQGTSKASFLFTGKDAGTLDLDSIYWLGLNGLEELISIDPSFNKYTDTLFSESSRDFERSILTQEAAKKVDESISGFLRLLSPYFLLRPAHKCLEWLVRVYEVHKCNIDGLMECVLPYYETNLFARLVQILRLGDDASFWSWLSPIQKEGTPLSRLSLVQHCLSDGSFLSFICNMVSSSLSQDEGPSCTNPHRVLISFYVSTVCGVLERGRVSEGLIGVLLPFIVNGLGSECGEYKCAMYMVSGLLASKTQLSTKAINSLLESIINNSIPSLMEEAVQCMLVVASSSDSLRTLTKKTVKGILSKKDSFLPALQELSTHTDSSYLLRPICITISRQYFHQLTVRGSETKAGGLGQVLYDLSSKTVLEAETVSYIAKDLLDQFCTSNKSGKKSAPVKYPFLTEVVQALTNKCPSVMDAVFAEERKGDRKKMIEKFVSLFLPGTYHELSLNNDVLNFYHHDTSVRLSAVKSLKSAITDGRGTSYPIHSYDDNFFSSVLLSRLTDDEPTVVKAVLDMGEEVLLKHIDKTELLNSLQKILRHKSQNWLSCIQSTLSILTSKSFCETYPVDTLVLVTLQYLTMDYHWKDQYISLLDVIATSYLSVNNQTLFSDLSLLLKGWSVDSSLSLDEFVQLQEKLISHLSERLVVMETVRFNKMVDDLLSLLLDDFTIFNNQLLHFLIIPLLGHALQTPGHALQLPLALKLVKYLQKFSSILSSSIPSNVHLMPVLNVILHHVAQKKMKTIIGGCHAHLLLWLINVLIDCTVSPTELPPSLWLHPPVLSPSPSSTNDEKYYFITFILFWLLTDSSDSKLTTPITDLSKSLLQKLFKVHFQGRGSLLRFLAMIWTAPTDSNNTGGASNGLLITEVTQVRALRIARAYLHSLDHEATIAMLSAYCPVVSSLLLPLSSTNTLIRKGAYHCIEALYSSTTDSQPEDQLTQIYSSCPLLHLLDYLTTCKVSIATDPIGLQLVLQSLYTSTGDGNERGAFPRLAPPDVPPSAKKRRGKKAGSLEEGERVREAIVESLLLMIVGLERGPLYMINQLLSILSGVDIKCKLSGLLKMMKELIQKVKEHDEHTMDTNKEFSSYPLSPMESHCIQWLVQCYTPVVASWLETEPEAFEVFLSLLSSTIPLSPTVPSLATLALNQITPQFYSSLSAVQCQQSILHSVLNLMIVSSSSNLTLTAKQCLQQLPLSSEILIAELLLEEDKLKPKEIDSTTGPATKKRKSKSHSIKADDGPKGDALLPWKRVTALLEVMTVLSERMGVESHAMVPPLFLFLSWSFEARETTKEETLDYTQQLVLNNLLKIYNILGDKGCRELLPEESFNVEQVVQCLRHSINPQNQHLSLLLLSTTASIYPDRILHNLMPVFAFMGSSLLRQDDSYTFDVINKTLESIVPTLVKSNFSSNSSKKTKRQSLSSVKKGTANPLHWSMAEVLRVFIDAVPHVPDHRRLPLLSHLIHITTPSHSLYLAIGLMIEKATVHHGMDNLPMSPKDELRLALYLAQEFSIHDQLNSLNQLLHYCREHLPQDKPGSKGLRSLSPDACLIFDVRLHSLEKLRSFRSTVVSVTALILERMKKEGNNEEIETNHELIMNILQECLYYINALNKYKGSSSGDAPSIKYCDLLIDKVKDLIDKLVSLLSETDFLNVLLQLTDTDSTSRKAIMVLTKKLEDKKWTITREQESILMEHVSILVNKCTRGGGGGEKEGAIQQAALLCLRQIINRIGANHSQKFISVTRSLLDAIGRDSGPVLNSSATSNALLCISESCAVLTVRLIPLLPTILSTALKYIEQSDKSSGSLVLSSLILIRTVIQTLPRFISSFVPSIITKICSGGFLEVAGKEDLLNEATLVRESVPVGVPSSVLLPAITEALPLVMKDGKSSVIALVNILRTCIGRLTKKTDVNQPILIDIFTALLEYRSNYQHEAESDVREVESEVNQSFTDLVVKLSEASFKPTLNKFLAWADSGDKILTFYHLIRDVAKKLKVLFLLFADQLVDSMVSLLSSCHLVNNKGLLPFSDSSCGSSIIKTNFCLQFLFDTLQICFLHDKGSFLNKERSQQLMEPLVEQITNTLSPEDNELYLTLMRTHLSPCIAQLAVAASSGETQWKKLNQQLLMKTRESKPMVRLCALQIAGSVYSKLGSEVNVILPEIIPFLSELMEDECEDVEKEVQETIKAIEAVTGESIQQYL